MGMTRASLQGTQSTRPDQSPKKGQPVGLRSFRNDRCSRPLPTWLQGLERGFRLRRGGGALVRRATTNSHEFGGRIRIRRPNSIEPSVSCRHSALLHSTVPPAAGQLTAHITLTMPRHAHRKDGTAVYSDDEDEYIYRTNYIWKRRQVKVLWRCHCRCL